MKKILALMESRRTLRFLLILLGLLLFANFMVGCAIGPVVRSEGVRAYRTPYTSVLPGYNTASLPCRGALTNVVIQRNSVGWNEDVVSVLGAGLMRRQCVWTKVPQKPSEVLYSLVVSVLQPGDQVVVDLELVENSSGVVVASRKVSHNHDYRQYSSYCSNVGCVSVTPRDQVVFYAMGIALGAAIDDL